MLACPSTSETTCSGVPWGPASARHLSGAAHADASGQARTSQLPRSSNLSGKLIHVKSIREVTARGSGFWYHAYEVELATWTTTWADSGGTRTRTLHKYELLINEARVPGPRYFSSEAGRQQFIRRSFSDLTLRDLDPPLRDDVAHPLAELVGQPLLRSYSWPTTSSSSGVTAA